VDLGVVDAPRDAGPRGENSAGKLAKSDSLPGAKSALNDTKNVHAKSAANPIKTSESVSASQLVPPVSASNKKPGLALGILGLVDQLIFDTFRPPDGARLNLSIVKGYRYLRWRWTNKDLGKREIHYLGALNPKGNNKKVITTALKESYEQGSTTRKRTNRGKRKAAGRGVRRRIVDA
jgi:hypothetical protein